MKIPFEINDDIIISNNDKDNDVSNGCLINSAAGRVAPGTVNMVQKLHKQHHLDQLS